MTQTEPFAAPKVATELSSHRYRRQYHIYSTDGLALAQVRQKKDPVVPLTKPPITCPRRGRLIAAEDSYEKATEHPV